MKLSLFTILMIITIIISLLMTGYLWAQPEPVRKEVAANLSWIMNETLFNMTPSYSIDTPNYLVTNITCNQNGCFAMFESGKIRKLPEDPWSANEVEIGRCYKVDLLGGWLEKDCITGRLINII